MKMKITREYVFVGIYIGISISCGMTATQPLYRIFSVAQIIPKRRFNSP